jgi:hypothetical protein
MSGRWDDYANCKGQHVDVFYPSGPGEGGTNVPHLIRALCRDCPVVMACRTASVAERYGWWGGTSQVERRKIRKAINYVLEPDMDATEINKFRRAADRGFTEGNMHTALARVIGAKAAAVVLGWRVM